MEIGVAISSAGARSVRHAAQWLGLSVINVVPILGVKPSAFYFPQNETDDSL
jgi:hypothetical protein